MFRKVAAPRRLLSLALVIAAAVTVLVNGTLPASAAELDCGAGPTGMDQSYTTPFGHSLKVIAPGLLTGATGTQITVETTTSPDQLLFFPSDDTSFAANAAITYPGHSGSFTYTPDPDTPFSGDDFFYFTIVDGCGNETYQEADVSVVPVVVDANYALAGATTLTVPAASGFLAHDKGVDAFSMTYDFFTAQGGEVDDAGAADGSFVYNPPAGFNGADSFGYSVSDLNGDHVYSATVHIQVAQSAVRPATPTHVAATADDGRAGVVWSAPSNGGSPITGYTITASPGNTTAVVDGSHTTASVPGLTNGVSYSFTVHATNAVGAGVESAASNSVVPRGRPGVATAVHASLHNGTVAVTWNAAAANGAPVTGYAVTTSGATVSVSGAVTHASFSKLSAGAHTFKVRAQNSVGSGTWSAASNAITIERATSHATARSGYWMLDAAGKVYAFGDAPRLGSAPGPAVAVAPRADGTGYWTVDARGNVAHFGAAGYHGGHPALRAGEVVSTISATPSAKGYWLFTNRGRAFAYGDAHFYGDMSAAVLNGPVVASVSTPTGRGYFMVGSDGGVFSFGDAVFHGSTGGIHLNKPVVGIAPTSDNGGYWLVASDGGVFAFKAPFRGSMGATHLNQPVNGLVGFGNGYLMVASDGGIFNFSDKRFFGSLANNPPPAPVIGVAAFSRA